MDSLAILYIVMQGGLFGTTLIASRFGVGQFDPTTFIGLRLLLASLGHAAVYLFSRQQRHWPTDANLWREATMLGILGTALPTTCIVSSLQYLSAGVASILLTTGPAVTLLIAHFFLADELLTRRKSLGVTLALGGALLLAVRGETGLTDITQANPLGYGLMAVAIIAGGAMSVYARKRMINLDAFDVASIRMFTATLVILPLSVVWAGLDLSRVNGQGYFSLVYAAIVGTFLGNLAAFYIIKRWGATPQALSLYVIPVVAGLGGWLILGEEITAVMLIGIALIAVGIGLIER